MRIARIDQRLAERGPVHFELGVRLPLEALDEQEIDRAHPCDQIVERRLGIAAQFVHQRPAPRRRDHDLGGARLAMPPGILPRPVDIEFVVGMLDRRHRNASRHQLGDQCRQQRCLAAAAPAGEAEDAHPERSLRHLGGRSSRRKRGTGGRRSGEMLGFSMSRPRRARHMGKPGAQVIIAGHQGQQRGHP